MVAAKQRRSYGENETSLGQLVDGVEVLPGGAFDGVYEILSRLLVELDIHCIEVLMYTAEFEQLDQVAVDRIGILLNTSE